MNKSVEKWIVDCVNSYFNFVAREFECPVLGLKLGIYKNTSKDYYIEFKFNEQISILSGGEKLSKGAMIDLLEHSFYKDFQKPKSPDIDKVYNFISKSVYSLDGTYKRVFQDKDLDIKIEIYTHALNSEGFHYHIEGNGKSEKIYLNTDCHLAEDLIDKIYSSYINDFLSYDAMLNDPLLYTGHLNNKNNTLQFQLADRDRQIYELKDKNSYLQEKVSDLKRINRSIIIDNNNKTKENYELRSELKRLIVDLQEEKAAHTLESCRAIYAKKILSGERDYKVNEYFSLGEDF